MQIIVWLRLHLTQLAHESCATTQGCQSTHRFLESVYTRCYKWFSSRALLNVTQQQIMPILIVVRTQECQAIVHRSRRDTFLLGRANNRDTKHDTKQITASEPLQSQRFLRDAAGCTLSPSVSKLQLEQISCDTVIPPSANSRRPAHQRRNKSAQVVRTSAPGAKHLPEESTARAFSAWPLCRNKAL